MADRNSAAATLGSTLALEGGASSASATVVSKQSKREDNKQLGLRMLGQYAS
jgi:hypothetical protein